MNVFKTTLLAAAVLAVAPLAAQAESSFTDTATTTSAKLDFEVKIPKILFLQVGTGAAFANGGSVDKLTFTVPSANLGVAGNAVAATGGNAGGSGVTARVLGNGGDVTLKADTAGAMHNGDINETISFSQISTISDNALLPAPTLVDGLATVASTRTLTAVKKVVDQSANWTYSYANTVTPAAGTYGGANNGRVTYTASMP